MKAHYIVDFMNTQAGDIPRIKTSLNFKDILGTIMVRWSINRSNYRVPPLLYAIGTPNETSDVFVTANYKLTFDIVRKNLDGLNCWLLVLDTNGINVWCAAGKKTFGTRELVNRIEQTKLEKVIKHRKIIVPQLGATGVSAHLVKKETSRASNSLIESPVRPTPDFKIANNLADTLKTNTGFNVVYGPVRAADIKSFVANGYKASKEMQKVTFTFTERAKLIPVDFMGNKYYGLGVLIVLLAISGFNNNGFGLNTLWINTPPIIFNLLSAYVAGIVLTPLALPYLPGRSFSFKGMVSGIIAVIFLLIFQKIEYSVLSLTAWTLLIVALSSFIAMNFTGSSTYTSLSGVRKEMKIAFPMQVSAALLGFVFLVLHNIL